MLIETAEMNTEIICMGMLGGIVIGPNVEEQHFNWEQRREIAQYKAALESLITNGLIKDVGDNGEFFDITDKGYNWIDRNK
jgi:hypothetical protein